MVAKDIKHWLRSLKVYCGEAAERSFGLSFADLQMLKTVVSSWSPFSEE